MPSATEKVVAARLLKRAKFHHVHVHEVERHGHWTRVLFTMGSGALSATFDGSRLYALELGWPA